MARRGQIRVGDGGGGGGGGGVLVGSVLPLPRRETRGLLSFLGFWIFLIRVLEFGTAANGTKGDPSWVTHAIQIFKYTQIFNAEEYFVLKCARANRCET